MKALKALFVKIINKILKNIVVNTWYKQLAGQIKQYKKHLEEFLKNEKSRSINIYSEWPEFKSYQSC